MTAAVQLRALLEPLGVYAWEDSFQWAELQGAGVALDEIDVALARSARETHLASAEDEGLVRLCALLAGVPVADTPAALRAAIAALLRIGDASFTAQAVRDNVSGCGLPAQVLETGLPGQVRVSFDGIPGVPDDFERLRMIIEQIVPCHMEILYHFWYLLWARLEEKLPSWRALEAKRFTWKSFERFVID